MARQRENRKPSQTGSKKYPYVGCGVYIFDQNDDGEMVPTFIAGLCYSELPQEATVALESAAAANTMQISEALKPVVEAMAEFGVQALESSKKS